MNNRKTKPTKGNGKDPDMLLVPRAFVLNAIQALTTKPEFIRPDVVVALVHELNKIANPELVAQAEAQQQQQANVSN